MTRRRTYWLPMALVLTALVGIALAGIALSGFAAGPSGDQLVSANAGTTNVMIALGAALFLGLEFAHQHHRRDSRRQRAAASSRH